jgi:hypothetical protein
MKLEVFEPEPGVSVPLAAHAAGVTVKTMRSWLTDNRIVLLVPRRSAGAWLRLAPIDVVRLAVAAQLLQFGFSIAESNEVLVEHLDRHLLGLSMLGEGGPPWHVLLSQMRGHSLAVSREHDGLAVTYSTMLGTKQAGHVASTLTVHVGWLCEAAHSRISETPSKPIKTNGTV